MSLFFKTRLNGCAFIFTRDIRRLCMLIRRGGGAVGIWHHCILRDTG